MHARFLSTVSFSSAPLHNKHQDRRHLYNPSPFAPERISSANGASASCRTSDNSYVATKVCTSRTIALWNILGAYLTQVQPLIFTGIRMRSFLFSSMQHVSQMHHNNKPHKRTHTTQALLFVMHQTYGHNKAGSYIFAGRDTSKLQ